MKKENIITKAAAGELKAFYLTFEDIDDIYTKEGYGAVIQEKNKKQPINEDNYPDFIMQVDKVNYLFTGWGFYRKEKDYEFVIELGDKLTQAELDTVFPRDMLDEE